MNFICSFLSYHKEILKKHQACGWPFCMPVQIPPFREGTLAKNI